MSIIRPWHVWLSIFSSLGFNYWLWGPECRGLSNHHVNLWARHQTEVDVVVISPFHPLCLAHLELVESNKAQSGIKMVPAARRRTEAKINWAASGTLGWLRGITPHLSPHVFTPHTFLTSQMGLLVHLPRVQASALLVLEIYQVQEIVLLAYSPSCEAFRRRPELEWKAAVISKASALVNQVSHQGACTLAVRKNETVHLRLVYLQVSRRGEHAFNMHHSSWYHAALA